MTLSNKKYRRKILVPGLAEYFKKVLREVREFHPDWFIEEVRWIGIMCICTW
jgi:REP element-mobilizing transposase RayT